MSNTNDRVDNWEIRYRPDGSFGVYDVHGLLAGPFGTKEEAMRAALGLPKDGPQVDKQHAVDRG
jgi:hypothetical protein